jgi:hypothetical protein
MSDFGAGVAACKKATAVNTIDHRDATLDPGASPALCMMHKIHRRNAPWRRLSLGTR